MANVLYPKFKQQLLSPGLDLLALPVHVALVDTSVYTYDPSHEFATVLGSAIVGTPQVLTNPVVLASGVFDADDVTFPAVAPVGTTVEALVLYLATGNPATSRLCSYQDTGVAGLPVLVNGGPIHVVFDNGPNRIFAL